MKFVTIAGPSASGKSTLSRLLKDQLDDATIISLDDFFLDRESVEERGVNFDHPDSIDWSDAKHAIQSALESDDYVLIPEYSFEKAERVGYREVEVGDVLIVEGLWALLSESIRYHSDLMVYIDTDVETRMARRIDRDTKNRGCTVEEALEYFQQAREMEIEHVEPTKEYADLIVEGRPTERTAEVLSKVVTTDSL